MISKLKFWVYLPFLGVVAGFLNALLGTGGGIPLFFGMRRFFEKKVANERSFFTTTLAATLFLSLFSLRAYAKNGALPAADPLTLLLPAILGGVCGALLLPHLSTWLLSKIFATVVLFSGILMVL